MDKNILFQELTTYQPIPTQQDDYVRFLDFVLQHDNPFDRTISEGHVTASALILSEDAQRLLLIYHDKLDRWLQPGGHAESGEYRGLDIAIREAQEETGIEHLVPIVGLIDIDVHQIPSGKEPAHPHYDLRYTFCATNERHNMNTQEVRDCQWVNFNDLECYDLCPALTRAAEKARHRHLMTRIVRNRSH